MFCVLHCKTDDCPVFYIVKLTMSCVLHDVTDIVLTAGGFSTDRAEETIMEAPKVPTLDIKNKRKPGGSVPTATDDDDRNLSVIDPGGNYGQGDVSMMMMMMMMCRKVVW